MKAQLTTALAATLLMSSGIAAQERRGASAPPPAVALQAALLVDSLAGVEDTMQLRMMARAGVPESDRSSSDLHLRYALIQKRLFELTDDDDVRKAAQHSFDKAKDQEPDDTWAHYGYGWSLAHAREFTDRFVHVLPGAATVATLGGLLGLDGGDRAKRALQRALDIDATFEPAVIELARLALITKQPGDIAAAASASRKAIGGGRATAGIYTQLAELEMLRGNSAAAAEAAKMGMKLRPDADAQRALGVALLAIPAESDAGAASYMEGLAEAGADSALLRAYAADAQPLFVDEERAVFGNLAAADKVAWLQKFWQRSAAKGGRTIGQRLTEHFRRLQYAFANYRREGRFAVRAGGAFIIDGDNQDLPFDDRGLLYVRLGKPDVTISTPAGDIVPPPNASWVYTRDGKTEMYHFHKYPGGSDWTLSPLEPCNPVFLKYGQTEADRSPGGTDRLLANLASLSSPKGGIGSESRYISYLEERAKYDHRLGTYMNRCQMAISDLAMAASPPSDATDEAKRSAIGRLTGGALDDLAMDAKVFMREDLNRVRAALKTDDARPRYETPLRAIAQLYAFRGRDETTALTAAVLIPGQRFTPAMNNGVLVYPLAMSLIVLDSASGDIQRADSKPSFRADQSLRSGQWFRAVIDMQARPAKDASYRLVVENTANAAEGDIRSGSQEIPAFTGNDLMISDIVVGESGDGRWKRGRTDINPIPSHQIERGKSFKLFYEIYNLPEGDRYRTTIAVTPKETGGIGGALKSIVGKKRGVEFNFDETASSPAQLYGLQQMRTIGADMEGGIYDLTVTITNIATQATTKRTAKLVVLSSKDLKAEKGG
jgi:hypothetical protein